MQFNKYLRNLIIVFFIHMVTGFVSNAQIICDQAYMRDYLSEGNVEPNANVSLDDGSVLVAGKGTVSATSVYKAMAIKLLPGGAVDWSILLGGNVDDRFTGITLLKDGNR